MSAVELLEAQAADLKHDVVLEIAAAVVPRLVLDLGRLGRRQPHLPQVGGHPHG
jgi:hypothetical protein